MLSHRTKTIKSAKCKTYLTLLGVLGTFGSSAYAIYQPKDYPRVAPPRITAKPAKRTRQTSARFGYTDRGHRVRFRCSLDGARFSSCRSPTRYPGPFAEGFHTFRVKALGSSRGRRVLGAPASYRWLVDLRPPAPRITQYPDVPTSSAGRATFAFVDRASRVSFQCKLDILVWSACSSPVSYRTVSLGEHHFGVRAIDSQGRLSPAARFDWVEVAESSESFSITAGGIADGALYPGASPYPIRVRLRNPNPVSIFVTRLSVAVWGGPAGCDSATNVSLVQSNVSSEAPLEIQARGSVTLPAQGRSAPTIGLVNLPVNQDACRNARFTLHFTGSAHG